MRLAPRLILSVALVGLSWPAAAIERVGDIRASALEVAPSVFPARPSLSSPGAGLGGYSPALSVPALPVSAALQASAAPTAAAGLRADRGSVAAASVLPAPRPEARSRPAVGHAGIEAPRFPEMASAENASVARSPAAQAPDGAGRPAAALPQAAAAVSEEAAGDGRVFDGAAVRAAAVAAPMVLLGGAATLPVAAGHLPHLSLSLGALSAAGPEVGALGYHFATALSVAFPLPETYAALRRGHAHGFPLGRALLGTIGGLALGMINAVMLHKSSWGVMQIFVGLGMLAPYVIGRVLDRRGGPLKPYLAPDGAKGPKAFANRLRRDQAVWVTAGVGAALLALSAGLYAASTAVLPGLLAPVMSAKAVSDLLLWIQVGKGLLFMAVFAPDAMALLHGKPTKGFSFWFTAIYLASVAAYTIWGFSAAAMSAAGPIRDQYLVLALRNAFEALASGLSLVAIVRAARRAAIKH